MSEPKNQSIEPETFTGLSDAPQQTNKTPEKDKGNNNITAIIVVSVLIVIAIAILIVPSLIPSSSFSDTKGTNTGSSEPTFQERPQQITTTPDETPWADAQLLKARREAQEILAELLGVQNRLETALVEIWAKEEFNQVLSLASEGDTLYTDRQFDQSVQHYQSALDLALQLDIQIPSFAMNYQQKGVDFLSENQVKTAIESLEIAQKIDPNLATSSNMLARAKNRTQVLRLIDLSKIAASKPDTLEVAKQYIIDAQTLDVEYRSLEERRIEIETQITERNYRQQMTAGYSALQQGQYDQASTAFIQAGKIKPNETASVEALQQVEAGKLNTARQRTLSSATELEENEQWQQALDQYDRLASEDPSLTSARLGRLRTKARVELDTDIKSVLDNPLGLQNQSTWQAAQKTLSDARGIINPSEQFKQQVFQLESVIKTARTPVIVKLQSDNQTEVEIYRVGLLGTFTEQAMNLNPGNYVIVGKRNGYQDVRVELAIDGSSTEVTVPIICSVTI